MRVYRYALGIADHQVIDLPLSSQILSVAPGRMVAGISPAAEHLDLWVLVPEVAPDVPYHIHIVGTGHPMPPELTRYGMEEVARQFIGSAVMPSHLVWHVFWAPQ